MDIGASSTPRLQAGSQGWPHTRPHTDAKGLGWRAYRYASSYRPSAINVTYRPAWVWTGQACMHGKLDSSQSKSTSLLRGFISRSRIGSPCPCPGYFFTVSVAVALSPVTSTACVVGFPSSLHVMSV